MWLPADSHFILMRDGHPRSPICDEERDNVARCVAVARSRAVPSKGNCPCLKRCFERRYLITFSSIGWTETLATHMTADVGKKGQRVLAKVCVYYRTTQVERIKKVPKITVSSHEKARTLFQFRYWVSQIRRRNKTLGQLLGHQRKDMIIGCRIGNSRDCNTEEHITLDMKGRRGNCFCVGCSRRLNETVKVNFITTPFENGVHLLVNLEIDEYIPLTNHIGLGITVHGAEVEAEFKRDAVGVPPFHTTYIGVRQRITERQEPPYPDPCQREWPTEYLSFIGEYRAYCPTECVDICIQIQIWQTCGCLSDNRFILMRNGFPRAPICDEERDNVARCVADAQSRAVRSKGNCPCLKRCFERRYLTTLSSIGWTKTLVSPLEAAHYRRFRHNPSPCAFRRTRLPGPNVAQHDRETSMSKFAVKSSRCSVSFPFCAPKDTHMTADAYKKGQRVLAKVCVYYTTTQIERIKKLPKITVHNLVAEIGSIVGLYLGLSFMLIFGVVDDITRMVVDACVNKWVQPARDRSSDRTH